MKSSNKTPTNNWADFIRFGDEFCLNCSRPAGLRLFLMATWKSGLGNDIYYIHRSVKPVKWPVADGGEEKVVFLREFF